MCMCMCISARLGAVSARSRRSTCALAPMAWDAPSGGTATTCHALGMLCYACALCMCVCETHARAKSATVSGAEGQRGRLAPSKLRLLVACLLVAPAESAASARSARAEGHACPCACRARPPACRPLDRSPARSVLAPAQRADSRSCTAYSRRPGNGRAQAAHHQSIAVSYRFSGLLFLLVPHGSRATRVLALGSLPYRLLGTSGRCIELAVHAETSAWGHLAPTMAPPAPAASFLLVSFSSRNILGRAWCSMGLVSCTRLEISSRVACVAC